MNRDGMKKYLAAEMCYTLNNHWGAAKIDFDYKSPSELIDALCSCRKVGANLLLNIGPEGQGKIPAIQSELMKIIGKWMQFYGEAVYNGKPTTISGLGKNFALEDDKNIYLFFFNLARTGNENVTVGGLYCGSYAFGNIDKKIDKVEWMDNGESLSFVQKDNMLAVNATGFPYGISTCVRVAKARKTI